MAWETDLVLMTRVLINDISLPQKYADLDIERTLVVAGIFVTNDIDLDYDYTFSISGPTISPDPVTNGDTIVQALLPLKAACIILQAEFKTALGRGIKVRDGDSSIDTSVGFTGYRDILKYGPCAAYDSLRWKIEAGRSGDLVGGAVLSGYRGPYDNPQLTVSWFYDTLANNLGNQQCNNNRLDR